MKKRLTVIRAETDGNIMGRNGFFKITAVQIYPMHVPLDDRHELKIEGVGVSGTVLNGGIWLTEKAMDKLANDWLKMRGKQVA